MNFTDCLQPLLRGINGNMKMALAVSSLVNSYCRVNTHCGEEKEVQDIVKIFEDKLQYNCRITNEDQYEKVMMALKGLGNTGHAERAIDTLNRCFLNKDAPTEVRVAAMNAFRRISCSAEVGLHSIDYKKLKFINRLIAILFI